jgi:selenocysteine lyase/cysteine desulfurase
MEAIAAYERTLSEHLLSTLADHGAIVYGVSDPAELNRRVPTVLFNMPGTTPQAVVEALARREIGARDGHMYAPRLMRRLGISPESGAVRLSLAHYNTKDEIDLLGRALKKMAS